MKFGNFLHTFTEIPEHNKGFSRGYKENSLSHVQAFVST